MEGMKKRFLAVFLAVFLVLGMLPGTAWAAEEDSGECGKNGGNVTWSLDSNGTLTISGSGEMQSFGSANSPWTANASTSDITEVVIGDGVTSIGDYAFQAHSSLLSVRIPDSVTAIGSHAFYGCGGLTGVTLPDNVISIGDKAFSLCAGLTGATIPNSVASIGNGVWDGCSRLSAITVSAGNLSYISDEDGVLYSKDMEHLVQYPAGKAGTSYRIPEGVTVIEQNAFLGCSRLTTVTLPDSVTAIEEGAFSGCSSLTGATLPDGLTSIGSYAFLECGSLTDVTIPDSVTAIRYGAFAGCSKLSEVYYSGTEESWKQINIQDHNDPLTGAHINYADTPTLVTLPDGVKYVPYSWAPEEASGTYEAVNMPGGLSLNAATGEISGIPQTAGTLEIKIRQTMMTMVTENGQTATHDLTCALTVQDNTDSNVDKASDYDIIDPVGTDTGNNHFVLDGYQDETLVINALHEAFSHLYIDGRLLVRDKDYESYEASGFGTAIKIYGQTFSDCGEGTHTIAAEWRDSDPGELTGLTKAAQNYTFAAPAPTRVTLPSGVKYVPYSWTPENANGTYTPVDPLPSGLDLDTATGEISGIPQAGSTWEINVRQTTVTADGQTVTTDLTYVITVQDNTDSNVERPNDYEISKPVGTDVGNKHFILDSYRNETLVIEGPYQEFTHLYIDGKLLTRDVDYEAHEGSTVITIFGQTFAKQGTGTHTISAEFRNSQGKLKTVSQNYTVNISTPSRPAVTAKPSTTTTTKPADTTPAPAPEAPAEGPAEPEGLPFGDVSPEDWFYGDVVWAYEGEIMSGVTATSFAPQTSISQATIVTVLSRMANIDLTKFSGVTDDVIPAGQWYTDAAVWAKQSGLLPDYNVFTGNETISRDQMAVMLSKYLQSMGKDTTVPAQPVAFADAGEMSQAGNDAFQVLYAYNIFRGVGDGRMDPNGSTTRAQFAALVHRISDTVK